jgi:hypothetical protein
VWLSVRGASSKKRLNASLYGAPTSYGGHPLTEAAQFENAVPPSR